MMTGKGRRKDLVFMRFFWEGLIIQTKKNLNYDNEVFTSFSPSYDARTYDEEMFSVEKIVNTRVGKDGKTKEVHVRFLQKKRRRRLFSYG